MYSSPQGYEGANLVWKLVLLLMMMMLLLLWDVSLLMLMHGYRRLDGTIGCHSVAKDREIWQEEEDR